MVAIDSGEVTTLSPDGLEDEAGGEIGEKDRLAGDLGGEAQASGHQDAEAI